MTTDVASRMHRRLLVVVAGVLVLTVAGLVALWPRADVLPEVPEGPEDLVTATIVEVVLLPGEPDPLVGGSGELARVTVEVEEGPDEGQVLTLPEVPTDGYPTFRVGDRVELERVGTPDGDEYYIRDFRRLPVLGLLVGLFAAAVLVIGRWHGLRSLVGLALSLLLVVQFVVPAILSGRNPPLVALVGALAIMIVTLYLTHGVNEMTTSAVVGTSGALTLTVAMGLLFIDQAKITGFASEEAIFARAAVGTLDLRGLVLAGLIIAALGVLDDVTVAQSSTVFALHDTDRTLTWSSLFSRGMKVGRDHIASVVNTLFLAYAGASLALLVLFSTGGLATAEIVNSEILAEEIVKTVVGSLGLIAAVPLTTALAAAVAVRRPPDAPPMGGGHLHGHGAASAVAADAVGAPDRPTSPTGRRPTAPPATGSDTEVLDEDERARRAWARYLGEDPDAPDGPGDPPSQGSGAR